LAEKINKNERKNSAEIFIEEFGEESKEFRDLLEMDDTFDSSVDVQASSICFIKYNFQVLVCITITMYTK